MDLILRNYIHYILNHTQWWSLWSNKCINQNSLHSSFFLPLSCFFPFPRLSALLQSKERAIHFTKLFLTRHCPPFLHILAIHPPHPYVHRMQMHYMSFMRMSFCVSGGPQKIIMGFSWLAPFPTNSLHCCLGWGVSAPIRLYTDQTHSETQHPWLSQLSSGFTLAYEHRCVPKLVLNT